MAKGYRPFTQEFKDSAVREVVERSRSVAEVANQVGIDVGTLRRWVRAWREQYGDERVGPVGSGGVSSGPVAAADLAARVAELERENRRLREREIILKKAAAFFAQDHL